MKYVFSWLDVKLGMRMMRKYPGVSLVIVFALAIGIPVSLMPNHLVDAATGESPPFDEGERVVGVVAFGQEGRTSLRVGDYELLRERLTTFASLGAAIPFEVDIISGDGRSPSRQSKWRRRRSVWDSGAVRGGMTWHVFRPSPTSIRAPQLPTVTSSPRSEFRHRN